MSYPSYDKWHFKIYSPKEQARLHAYYPYFLSDNSNPNKDKYFDKSMGYDFTLAYFKVIEHHYDLYNYTDNICVDYVDTDGISHNQFYDCGNGWNIISRGSWSWADEDTNQRILDHLKATGEFSLPVANPCKCTYVGSQGTMKM